MFVLKGWGFSLNLKLETKNCKKVSIITVTYNSGRHIKTCIDSVNSQSWPFLEHVFIDGMSKDNTLSIIDTRSKREKIVISEPDNGIYDAMNKGLKLATGNIIGILNADDWYADDMVLERVVNVFEDPSVDACYGDLVYVQESDTRRNQKPNTNYQLPDFKILRYWKSGLFSPEKFKWGWMPPHPTFFVRRAVYETYGFFNLDLGSAADYELMLRFLFKHRIKVTYIPEVLVCMRAGGVSNVSIKNRLKANRMDRKAWDINGLEPYPWTIAMKPIRKIPQYFFKSKKIKF